MITATIIKSPEGNQIVIRSFQRGTADVSDRAPHGTDIQDLWNTATKGTTSGQDSRPEARVLTQPATSACSLTEVSTGLYQNWHPVAVVDDTEGEHIRIFPDQTVKVTKEYLSLNEA